MTLRNTLAFLALVACSSLAAAADYTVGGVLVIQPWTRATAPGATGGGAFMKIENRGPADRLVSASSDRAASVELHTMRMDGNIMRMDKLEHGIELPAGSTTELKPGGLHVMLFGLKTPLKEGERFPLNLKFEKAGKLRVEVSVGGLGAAAPAGEMHGQHMKQ